jgi:hypothetical protein
MDRERRIGNAWIAAISCAALVPRCLWLADMEYKHDEALTVRTIARASWNTWTSLAPVSDHSGIAHSSGFFYLLFGLAPDAQPLTIVATIAILNFLAIVVPLWCLRRSEKYVFTFALCATSLTLILGSRKIWTPDLQAAWVCLCIGLLGASSRHPKLLSLPLTCLGALCLVMAGHMYLPAACVAAVGCAAALVSFALLKRWGQLTAWAFGAALGWSTFIPWAMALLSRAPGSRAAHAQTRPFSVDQYLAALRMGFSVHTPYDAYALYLQPERGWMLREHASFWLSSTRFWIGTAVVIGTVLFVVAIFKALRNPREVARDPLLLTACGLLLTMPLALFYARLGTYIHYWLAAVPFFYYWIAWSAARGVALWRWLTIGACFTSWLAAASFAALVHEYKGLPGEYGTTYNSKYPQN